MQIQDRLDALKSELRISSSGDEVRIDMLSRRETLPDAMALLAQLLRNPAFPPAALEELKRQIASEIDAQRDDPEALVSNALARRGDPYPRGDVRHARSFDERLQDSMAVTVERMKEFHARFYGANQARFAAVGDFDVDALRRALTSRLRRLDRSGADRARAAPGVHRAPRAARSCARRTSRTPRSACKCTCRCRTTKPCTRR